MVRGAHRGCGLDSETPANDKRARLARRGWEDMMGYPISNKECPMSKWNALRIFSRRGAETQGNDGKKVGRNSRQAPQALPLFFDRINREGKVKPSEATHSSNIPPRPAVHCTPAISPYQDNLSLPPGFITILEAAATNVVASVLYGVRAVGRSALLARTPKVAFGVHDYDIPWPVSNS